MAAKSATVIKYKYSSVVDLHVVQQTAELTHVRVADDVSIVLINETLSFLLKLCLRRVRPPVHQITVRVHQTT